MLGNETDDVYTESVIGAGAQGYLCHASSEVDLRRAVAVVRDGSMWAPRKVLARLLERARAGEQRNLAEEPALTRREVQVLRLLMLGHPNRDIAAALGVDEGTVKSHLGRLMRKAGVRNRTGADAAVCGGRLDFLNREWEKLPKYVNVSTVAVT